MTDDEKQLLEKLLDGLDRLFDRKSSAVDLQALIFATSKSFVNTECFSILNDASESLEEIVRAKLNAGEESEAALDATNELRLFLAGILV